MEDVGSFVGSSMRVGDISARYGKNANYFHDRFMHESQRIYRMLTKICNTVLGENHEFNNTTRGALQNNDIYRPSLRLYRFIPVQGN
jgi:hypothetical protein